MQWRAMWWAALVLGACGPKLVEEPPTELDPLDDDEGEDENDGPNLEDLTPTTEPLPEGAQVPWVGLVSPGIAGETNSVVVSQVVPGNRIFLLLAPTGGSFTTPDCGMTLDLADPQLLGIVEGDSSGLAQFSFEVDLTDAERDLVFQAVDLESCVVSAPLPTWFKDPGPDPGTTGGTTTTPGTTPGTTTPGTTPGTTTPSGPPTVCYPGDRGAYDVCVRLDPAGTQGGDYAYPSSTSSNYGAPTHYLRLADIPASVKVAPNFQRDELAQEWKGDWGVVQVHAVERLQDLRDAVGVLVVNSGYRSPDYNASVGGATFSRHMYGDAFDLAPSSVSLSQLESECYAHGAGFVSVYTSHVHCDWRNDSQEPEFFGGFPPPQQVMNAASPPRAGMGWRGGRLVADATGFDCGEPLREWTAYDADGEVLAQATGADFEPPAGAVEVDVLVGRVVRETLQLPE